jgi:hypothetical protein
MDGLDEERPQNGKEVLLEEKWIGGRAENWANIDDPGFEH